MFIVLNDIVKKKECCQFAIFVLSLDCFVFYHSLQQFICYFIFICKFFHIFFISKVISVKLRGIFLIIDKESNGL